MKQLLKRSQFLKDLVSAFRKLPVDLATIRGTLNRKKQIARYFKGTQNRKLHIGCGKNVLHGWLNCDHSPASPEVVYLDATTPFPFSPATYDFIFSEHMIEHVPYSGGQTMLSECFRVLKPGGKIRISTPNLRNIASLMSEPLTPEKESYVRTATDRYICDNAQYLPGFVLNNFYWDFWHYFIYDPDTLKQALENVGFQQVQQMASGAGSVVELSGLECHATIVGSNLDAFESMVFEATKVA